MSRPIGRPPGAVVVVIPVATLLGHKTLSFLTAPEEPAKAKRALQKIWTAESKKDALASVPRLGRKLGKAVESLLKDCEALLAFSDFPAGHLEISAHEQRHRKFARNQSLLD
jgi:hypothetical protein